MKNILSLLSLAVVLVLAGSVLGGCGLSKSKTNPINSNQSADIQIDQTAATDNSNATEEQPVIDVEAGADVSDAGLNEEVKILDTEMDQVKTTGFEATNLTDKDLGL